MKSKMLQRRAAKQTKVAVTDETINQALLIADQLISDLSADDPRADAIAEIGDRLRAGSNDAAADVQQLAQFRRAIRGQRPTGNEPEEAAFVEGSGSDNFVMNNEHPDSVEQHIVEGSDQGSNGFVTDRDENGKPKTPETLEVPRIATEDVNADKTAVAPPGWEGTVKEMKKHDEIDNPWALAWSMKNKGYHSHAALAALKTRGALSLLKEAGMKSKLAAPPAPAPPAPAADANIFNAWTSDCLAAAIKAVTSTAEYASDKAAQQGVGMMNDALKNRPAMPEQPGMATASAKKKEAGSGSDGFTAQNEKTGVIEEGDTSIPSSHKNQELQGLDKSGKFPRPETVLPEKFAGEQGIKKLMSSLVLAGAE